MQTAISSKTRHVLSFLIACIAAVGLLMTFGVGVAHAAIDPAAAADTQHPGTDVNVDAGWQEFITNEIGTSSTKGPWSFTSSSVVKITITDAFCHGDQFSVYDNGTLLGDTSEVAPDVTCDFQLFFPPNTRADAAILDPGFSQGTFFVAPGEHSLDMVTKVLWTETAAGTGAYFRLDSVQLTKNDCKNNGWQNYGALFSNQGSCVSLTQQVAKAN